MVERISGDNETVEGGGSGEEKMHEEYSSELPGHCEATLSSEGQLTKM